MSERIGICNKCGQRYGDIPESVTALKVKCQSCDGTVEIPPLPVPAAAPPAEKPLAAPLGGARPKADRPEKAKSIDRDIAAPEIPEVRKPVAPSKAVVKVPAPIKPVKLAKPVMPLKPIAKVAKPVAPLKPIAKVAKPVAAAAPPAHKPAAADIIAKAKAKRAAEATAGVAAEQKSSASDIIAKAKAKRNATATPAAASNAPVTQRDSRLPKPSGTRRPGGTSKTSASSRRRHNEEEEVEKSKAPMVIVGVIALAVICGGAWWVMRPDAAPTQDENTVQVPADETPAPNASNPGAKEVQPVVGNEAKEVQPVAADSENLDSADANGGPADEAAVDAKPAPVVIPASGVDWVVPAVGEGISTRGVIDYKIILLEQVPQLEKWSGNSAAEWTEIQEDLALFLDDSGAQSNRAGLRLVESYPRGAYPAIVNALMKVNFEDKDGMFLASTLNELLIKIGQGTNYGWESTANLEAGSEAWAKAVLFNKKIVGVWQKAWVEKYIENDDAWANFSSSAADKKAAKDKAAKPKGDVVGPEEDIFD